jgi:hypothetical protein
MTPSLIAGCWILVKNSRRNMRSCRNIGCYLLLISRVLRDSKLDRSNWSFCWQNLFHLFNYLWLLNWNWGLGFGDLSWYWDLFFFNWCRLNFFLFYWLYRDFILNHWCWNRYFFLFYGRSYYFILYHWRGLYFFLFYRCWRWFLCIQRSKCALIRCFC